MFGTWASNLAFRPLLTALPQRRLAARWRYTAEVPPDQAIGGGTPSTLVANAGSQPQTAHACRTDDRPNSSAARCGSGLAQASSQSSTYSPSPVSQWAAAGDSVAVANPAVGMRVREEGRPRVPSIAGPPPDLDLLGVPRATYDEVAGRRLGRQTGEQAHRQVERAAS